MTTLLYSVSIVTEQKMRWWRVDIVPFLFLHHFTHPLCPSTLVSLHMTHITHHTEADSHQRMKLTLCWNEIRLTEPSGVLVFHNELYLQRKRYDLLNEIMSFQLPVYILPGLSLVVYSLNVELNIEARRTLPPRSTVAWIVPHLYVTFDKSVWQMTKCKLVCGFILA